MVLAFTQRLPVKNELNADCVWDLVANETQHMHERHGTFQGVDISKLIISQKQPSHVGH